MLLRAKPGRALANLEIELGRRNRDGFLQRILRFRSSAQRAKGGSGPAIGRRKSGKRPDRALCGFERGVVVAAKIVSQSKLGQTVHQRRRAGIEPDTFFQRRKSVARPPRIGQRHAERAMRGGEVRAERKRPPGRRAPWRAAPALLTRSGCPWSG